MWLVVILYSLQGCLWLPGYGGLWEGTSPREVHIQGQVLISHLLGEVTEVFCSKLITSPEPLIFVTAGTLDLQIVTIATV